MPTTRKLARRWTTMYCAHSRSHAGTQVPGRTSYAKRHLDIDRGSSKRLVAAAENRLHAYDRRVHLSRHNKEVKALKQDLGSKIAQYFTAAQQVAGGKL